MTKREFIDFTQALDFDVLMRNFQSHQEFVTESKTALETAQREFQLKRQFHDLMLDYRELHGLMLKKLLDANTKEDIEAIRAYTNRKIVPILQKIKAIQAQMSGEVATETQESRNAIQDKMEQLKGLLKVAEKLKEEVKEPEIIPA